MVKKSSYVEGYIQAKNYRLHYLEWGRGGPVAILLHGSAPFCSAHDLEALGEALGSSHHVVAFDLIGHAKSDDPKEELGLEKHVSILREAATLRGIKEASLIGWSYGGWLTMVWANLHPDEVKRIALIDIFPISYERPTPQDPENTPESFRCVEEGVDFYMNSFTPSYDRPPTQARRYVEESLRLAERDCDGRLIPLSHHRRRLLFRKDLDMWDIYSGIEAPMLLVWGRDSFIPAEAVGRMRAMKSTLTVVEVEGANHFVAVSHPDETIRAVKSFLEVN